MAGRPGWGEANWGGGTARRRPRTRSREPARRAHHSGARDGSPPEPRPRAGAAARPAGWRRRSPGRARRDLGGVLAAMTETAYHSVDGLAVGIDARVLHVTLDRPDKRNAIS